eukprot:4709689-Amphidinium_carterae.1
MVTDLRRKLLDTGACTCFEWPAFLGELPPSVEAQYQRLEDCRESWHDYVNDMWARNPKKIYQWI